MKPPAQDEHEAGAAEPEGPPSGRSGARAVGQRPSLADAGRAALAPGLVVAERYRLERVLKSGGMGSVWVATHLGLQSPVAIKFMAYRPGPDATPEAIAAARARFEREASAAAQIRMVNV